MPQNLDTSILETGIETKHLSILQEWGRFLANDAPNRKKMTTSQIRRFFGEIKRIQADFKNCKKSVVLLDPKIAYAVGREKKDSKNQGLAIEEFYKLLSPMIRNINEDEKRFKNFVHLCESIVAYHRAEGGI